MKTQITHEALEILHVILQKIDVRADSFSVPHLHAEILRDKYPSEVDGIRTGLYDKHRKDFKDRGVYVNIVDWLKIEKFAVDAPNTLSDTMNLKFTHKGDLLWAYGDAYKYDRSLAVTDIDKIQSRINQIFRTCPRFADFIVTQPLPKIRVVNINFLNPNDHEESGKIDRVLSGKDDLISQHENRMLDESATSFLMSEGFATLRHDIPKDEIGRPHIQLTDRGRKLQDLGSVEEFYKWEKEENEEDILKIKREREFIKSQVEFAKLNETLAQKQYELNSNQIITNNASKRTNYYIAIFTGAAAIWYVRDIAKNILLNYFPNDDIFNPSLLHTPNVYLDSVTIVAVCLGVWLTVKNNRRV